MTDLLLEINHLTVRFPRENGYFFALDNVQFSLAHGETLALVGESGSGKTLTALSILQLLPGGAQLSSASRVFLAQLNLLDLPEITLQKIRGRRIGIIFQEASSALNPVFTIGQQIDETLQCHFQLTARVRKERILSLLTQVGIDDPKHCVKSYPHTLSGGMRQRAMIAMVLAAEPEILIADEPTTALDVTLQAQILALLKNIQREKKMSLLFITHDLNIVKQIADRVAVIAHGKIVEQASTINFFQHPQHAYSRKLFAALPSWENRTESPDVIPSEARDLMNMAEHIVKNTADILKVQNLKIYYPIHKGVFQRVVGYVKAVDDVSFAMKQGKTFALVGESGCGKTSIAKGILRLVVPTGGNVEFLHWPLTQMSERALYKIRGHLQMIFQDPYAAMNPRMRIGAIIAEGMLAQKLAISLEECEPVIDELLRRVGLPKNSKQRFPNEFSGGQRQRICIARALAMKPKLIICDEPTSALDVVVQMEILQLLQELQRDLGLSYLLITHNIAVVAYLAHDVAVMRQGKIVEQGEVEQILFSPQHEYTQQLVNNPLSSFVGII
jgi:peptide/nickel transport system ATP-binding protein